MLKAYGPPSEIPKNPGKNLKVTGTMPIRVFVVEDFHNQQVLLRDLFASIGNLAIAGVATTEAEAKLWLEDHVGGWDLAVVDLVLAQGSGMAVVQHAARVNPAGKIVVFSGYVSTGLQSHCIVLGATAVFDKARSAEFVVWLHQFANS